MDRGTSARRLSSGVSSRSSLIKIQMLTEFSSDFDRSVVFVVAQSALLCLVEAKRTGTFPRAMMHKLYANECLLQPLLVGISCVGWVCNHFTGLKFPGQSDISAAVGAFAVGLIANLYGRFFNGNAFVIMVCALVSTATKL